MRNLRGLQIKPMNCPQKWPNWLDDVWAKSPVEGQATGQSLACHTWEVLERLADLRKLRPNLADDIHVPNFWSRMFWMCLLHDLGKCAQGFQDILHGKRETELAKHWGKHRHEVISLAFVDWVFPAGPPVLAQDRLWVIGGIASHHRDAGLIQGTYPTENDEDVQKILGFISPGVVRGIYRWLNECADDWAQHLELPANGLKLAVSEEQAAHEFTGRGVKRVRAALNEYQRWVCQLKNSKQPAPAELLLRGFITQADHTASAGAGSIPGLQTDGPTLRAKWEAEAEAQGRIFSSYAHQNASGEAQGTRLLIAPTGSGKTEAALLWAAAQKDTPRLFYTLPFQASMNAMFKRLEGTFGKDAIGLAHGRALLALYRLISEEEPDSKKAEQQARRRRNLTGLHHPPIQIFSPYQMLKAAYQLKGYEGMIADFQNAAFIFDEIHAYDPGRLALIIEMMRYLKEHHGAKFFIMSATFPSLIRQKLDEALGGQAPIQADDDLYARFCRHELRMMPDEMFEPENWNAIQNDIELGKTVLICCNTVKRAQMAVERVRSEFPDVKAVLLHGRLNGRDRIERERQVREAVGSTSQQRQRIVLVATQVVEVSLDIDLDTIYTDPAPLEALVQRFGRVNRRRLQPQPAPVHVFTQPDTGQRIYKPYLVQGALEILNREDGKPIPEDKIGAWLDEIYQGVARDAWLKNYEDAVAFCHRTLLRGLRPFQSDPRIAQDFYAAFDGVDVLPMRFEQEYDALIETDPLRAQELLVSIRSYALPKIIATGRLRSNPDDYPLKVDLPYDDELGLNINALYTK